MGVGKINKWKRENKNKTFFEKPRMNERVRDGEIIISILEQYCPLPLLELELLQNTVRTKKVLYQFLFCTLQMF